MRTKPSKQMFESFAKSTDNFCSRFPDGRGFYRRRDVSSFSWLGAPAGRVTKGCDGHFCWSRSHTRGFTNIGAWMHRSRCRVHFPGSMFRALKL